MPRDPSPEEEKQRIQEIKALRKLARQGDMVAQYKLWYKLGSNDRDEGTEWIRQSAMQGYAKAQVDFGILVIEGKVKESWNLFGWLSDSQSTRRSKAAQDLVDGMAWWHKAAQQGNAFAQFMLGAAYATGKAVGKYGYDIEISMREGQNILQDPIVAMKWYHKAADQGLAYAQKKLARAYYYGEGVERSRVEGVKWYRKLAESGDAVSQFELGLIYVSETETARFTVEGLRWIRKSAEQGNAEAQKHLAGVYYYGKGVPVDQGEGLRWHHIYNANLKQQEFERSVNY